jgi:signal transduction histidine kinase
MKSISVNGRIQNKSFPGGSKDKADDQYSYFQTFVIEVDFIRSAVFLNGVDISSSGFTEEERDSVITLAKDVLSNTNENPGVLDNYNLRFYTTDITADRIFGSITSGKRIVFLDKSYEDNTMKQLIVNFALVGSVALAAFLVISIIIAKLAVAPVEKSWKQQQQLVADASHELKTPITVISANAEFCLQQGLTIAGAEKWIQYIKTESSRMTALINNMLFLAKTDETKRAETQSIII